MNAIEGKGLLITDTDGSRTFQISQEGIYIDGTLQRPRKYFGNLLIKASDLIKKMAYTTK